MFGHLEYVDNLKDEGRVCAIVDRLLNYLENKGSTEEICRIYLRRIMHTYYKFDYKAHRRSLGLQVESKVRQIMEMLDFGLIWKLAATKLKLVLNGNQSGVCLRGIC